MGDAVKRVVGAKAEHIGKRGGIALLRRGGTQCLEQFSRRFGAHPVRQPVQLAGEGQVVQQERLRSLRTPAVARRISGGNARGGIAGDALHGRGEYVMGGERRHGASSLAWHEIWF